MLEDPTLVSTVKMRKTGVVASVFRDSRFIPLTKLDDTKIKKFHGMALPRDSELHSLLNHHILKLINSGLLISGQKYPKDTRKAGSYALGFDNLILPVGVFGVGTVLALLFAALEKIVEEYILTTYLFI